MQNYVLSAIQARQKYFHSIHFKRTTHLPYSNQSTVVGSRCGVLGNSLNLKDVYDYPTHLTIFLIVLCNLEHMKKNTTGLSVISKHSRINVELLTDQNQNQNKFRQNSSTSSSPACYQGYSRKELGSENLFLKKLNG